MHRSPLVVGNWKMNFSLEEATGYATRLKRKLKDSRGVEVVICPGMLALQAVSKVFKASDLKLGAQNLAAREEGPLTGEVAATQIKEFATHVIIGHSERRIHLGETDREIAQKLALAHLHGLTPILAVGETLHDYEENLSARVVNSQVTNGLRELDAEEVSRSVIAYEPVWSIGTGKPCTPRAAGQMLEGIGSLVASLYGEEASRALRLLYGGSVSPLNAEAYLDFSHCEGLLVGGASLDLEDFAGIIHSAETVKA